MLYQRHRQFSHRVSSSFIANVQTRASSHAPSGVDQEEVIKKLQAHLETSGLHSNLSPEDIAVLVEQAEVQHTEWWEKVKPSPTTSLEEVPFRWVAQLRCHARHQIKLVASGCVH